MRRASRMLALSMALLAGCTVSSSDTDSAQLDGPIPFNLADLQSCPGPRGPTCLGWSQTGALSSLRSFHTATLLTDGKVLVAGGFSLRDYLATEEIYDPASGTWRATGYLVEPRYANTASLLHSGKVLLTGGDNSLGTAEVFTPCAP